MNKDLISVIMSVYNEQEEWLKQSIESILNQTYRCFEFIIVLDNPLNVSAKNLLEEYQVKDSRIKLVFNDENIGLTKSLNKALKLVKGDFIARMDADDISEPKRLEIQYYFFMENSDIDFTSTNGIIMDENGVELYRTTTYGGSYSKAKSSLKYRNIFLHPSWMFRREILIKLQEYHDIPSAEDYDFLCRMSLAGYRFCIIKNHLIRYRIRANGISKTNLLKQKRVADCLKKHYIDSLDNPGAYNSLERSIEKIQVTRKEERNYSKASELYIKGINSSKKGKKLKTLFYITSSCLISKDKIKEIITVLNLRKVR
ncbi:glycosyltransferase involved in cell wall biosynthesis [Peribacillus sp. B2I2]|uniref:glycosyltransferase n=1 Tax=Peribacillus sp. B2I2 TaxID=3156468 RepID=UPI003512E367